MIRLAAIKLLRAVLTVWIVVTLAFVVLSVTGNPAETLAGPEAPAAVIEAYEERFGLNRPLGERYLSYLSSLAQGDFGISYADRRPAADIITEALPATLQLALVALAFAIVTGITFGFIAALYRNSAIDRGIMTLAVLGYATPNFFLGIVLIILFAMVWRVLPSSGHGTWAHLVLPALTLGTHNAATIARFTRSAVLEVLNQPYMIAARARGVPALRLMRAHVWPNAAIPVVTILGFRFGDVIVGTIVVETVFAWPGLGRVLVSAVSDRDLAVVLAFLILSACVMITVNLIVDLTYGLLDPRVRALQTRRT
ncbi:ABC transporter permease [Pontivivens ytuae]|uniref:ABC transporter permease n=1 Tax=Pontivivens ytuae TaxID=2789856 RepID=A0A7S9QDF8_9RHOB|nr:ABC transporter permease [Pontivivens ytuae]QPH54953.1 ABC transporter permease [Pontivivens ytuae]